MKEMVGSKEPDFVEKAPNTCPNLCGPVHRMLGKRKVSIRKESEQRRVAV